jgi:hypothetical protein
MTVAANKMFAFYLNLLSPESKYAWNKIVSEQMESDPYVNLQGDSLEGPRGMSCKLFTDCVMFHLLTAFPINASEQENSPHANASTKPKNVLFTEAELGAHVLRMHPLMWQDQYN